MTDFSQLLSELKQKRDELALQIHLGSKEAQAQWSDLEKKWDQFSADARLGESATEIGTAAKELGKELLAGYENIKKAIR
jgi:hypothetical protein